MSNLYDDFFKCGATLYTAVTSKHALKCEGCAFMPFGSPLCIRAPLCNSTFREDGRDIIWLLVDNKDNHWGRKKVTDLISLVSKEIQDGGH